MSIIVREGETIRVKADFHWWSYKYSFLWFGLMCLSALGQLLGTMKGIANMSLGNAFTIVIVGGIPYAVRRLQNRCKTYAVTSERLYLEEGVVSKRRKEIVLTKINDVEFSQSIFQRMVGTGDVVILTGNDSPTRISNITEPEAFKNQLTNSHRSNQSAA